MTPERIKVLTLKRKLLANDPESAAVVEQIDRLLGIKAKRQPRKSSDPALGKTSPLARIPTDTGTELRVEVMRYKTFERIDLRLWFMSDGEEAYIPSRKGVSIDARHLAAVIAALQEARSFVVAP